METNHVGLEHGNQVGESPRDSSGCSTDVRCESVAVGDQILNVSLIVRTDVLVCPSCLVKAAQAALLAILRPVDAKAYVGVQSYDSEEVIDLSNISWD